jgi:PAS domain S-box-containing protein
MLPDLMRFSWNAVPYFPGALLIATAGAWTLVRERGNRVSRDFFAFTSLFAAWMLMLGTRLLLVDAEAAITVSRYIYAVVSLGLPPLLAFTFTVLDTWRQRRLILQASCVLGTLLALAAVGTPWIVADVSRMPWGFEPRQGPLGMVFSLWVAASIGTMSFDAFSAWRHSRPNPFQRRQIRLFCVSLAVLFVAATDLLTDAIGVPAYPVGIACILVFTLMAAYLTIRHGLVNVTARFASPAFADVMRAGFVILDHDAVIQFINEASARMLGQRRRELVGQSLASLLGQPSQALAAMAHAADGGSEVTYRRARDKAPRHLTLSVSAMNDARGKPTAFVCLLRDVTEEHRARERQAALRAPEPTLEELELRQALANNEFVVHYQPVIELKRGMVAGFEALVRWSHPRLGLRAPCDFLPAAEALGLLGAIDRRVLEQACSDLPRLRAESGVPTLFVSVNQSTTALSCPTLVGDATELVARCGLAPKDVRLELLESTVVIDSVRETLRGLRDAGFGVCIDDFGTGHSALSRLHEAPVSGLKIDRLFVREMLGGNGRKIIGSIVALANSLELGVIAEGVTSPEQVALLREMGCGYAQGFMYSPPLALEDTISLVRKRIAARDRRMQVLEARAIHAGA